ncbi:MAG: MBOAT family O-acyltransferase [Planctomycetota bacterium]|jgi:D-alanyl-lipoteichoic acid acyltransferase DltB (MBOAT superfamily)
MLFNTFEFWLFFIPVLFAVYILPHRGQNRVLLIASYIFYGAWDWRFLSLLFISTIVDYFIAPLAQPSRPSRHRKIAVFISVAVNLGILGFFKYANFFIQSFSDLFGIANDSQNTLLLNIILPVGISFYTFQTMSYTLDVYSGKMKPIRSLEDFALFVAFFPQLVAGPIERASRLIPQIQSERSINCEQTVSAIYLILWGLFKKVVIADTIAHPVNNIFGSSSSIGPLVYLGTIGFAIQIYCDFSGYTDIARGLAKLLGFDLMLNFNVPYFSKNISEFWHRWHISLSTWLRDYLYIPLGGNRKGTGRTYFNLMATMVLGGLWHGARYNFLLWGIYHGLLLCLHRLLKSMMEARKINIQIPGMIRTFVTFHFVLFGWLLFRVETMDQLARMLESFTIKWNHWESVAAFVQYIGPMVIVLILVQIVQHAGKDSFLRERFPWYLHVVCCGLLLASILILNQSNGSPFIYFQF